MGTQYDGDLLGLVLVLGEDKSQGSSAGKASQKLQP
jgi:hypothetical protein